MIKLSTNQADTLSSLRGLSALLVAFSHSYIIFASHIYPSFYPVFAGLAQSSVMAFFVMSGLLIGVSVQNNKFLYGKFNLSKFALSRFERIYPPLVASLVLTFIISIVSVYILPMSNGRPLSAWERMPGYSLDFHAAEYFSTLTLTNSLLAKPISSNGALWSLPIECWYYVVAGLLSFKNNIVKLVGLLIFLIIQGISIKFRLFAIVWFLSFAASFFIFKPEVIKLKWILSLLILSIPLTYMTSFFFDELITTKVGLNYNLFFGLSFLMFILITMIVNLKFSMFKYTAGYSYTLYLIHFPIMVFIVALSMKYNMSNKFNDLFLALLSPMFCLVLSSFISKLTENKEALRKLLS